MVQYATVRDIVINRGQTNGLVWWVYQDIDTGVNIVPNSPLCQLYDPSSVQRLPSSTSSTAAGFFTPNFDTSGAITGVAKAAYFYIGTMDPNAQIGLWYVRTTYDWEGVASDLNIGFSVARGGATISGDATNPPVPVYAFHKDVQNFLLANVTLGANSTPTADQIDNYISMAEGQFEARTGVAYKPVMIQDEVHNQDTYRTAFLDTIYPNGAFNRRPIRLDYRPLLPFDATRGHKLEIYRGSDTPATSTDPIPRWVDLSQLSHSRNGDYWFDANAGKLYIRNTLMLRPGNSIRVTYEYGKPITKLTSPTQGKPLTIEVASTYRYQARGIIRIGQTYIFHTGKTETTFTGCQWGVLGTQADNYNTGVEVFEVPENIRSLVVMRAAALFLENEVFVSIGGETGSTAPKYSDKIKSWNDQWEKALSSTYQRWANF